MASFVQGGDAVEYTPGAATPAGSVVVQGDLIGVARVEIAAGQVGALAVSGVFDFAKEAALAIAAGVNVYWDAAVCDKFLWRWRWGNGTIWEG